MTVAYETILHRPSAIGSEGLKSRKDEKHKRSWGETNIVSIRYASIDEVLTNAFIRVSQCITWKNELRMWIKSCKKSPFVDIVMSLQNVESK